LRPGRSAVDASGERLVAEALLENTSIVVGRLVPVAAHDVVDVRAVLLRVGTKAGTEAELFLTRKERNQKQLRESRRMHSYLMNDDHS